MGDLSGSPGVASIFEKFPKHFPAHDNIDSKEKFKKQVPAHDNTDSEEQQRINAHIHETQGIQGTQQIQRKNSREGSNEEAPI